jgi:hypothetical protein
VRIDGWFMLAVWLTTGAAAKSRFHKSNNTDGALGGAQCRAP